MLKDEMFWLVSTDPPKEVATNILLSLGEESTR